MTGTVDIGRQNWRMLMEIAAGKNWGTVNWNSGMQAFTVQCINGMKIREGLSLLFSKLR
jgi:hypothetical protein